MCVAQVFQLPLFVQFQTKLLVLRKTQASSSARIRKANYEFIALHCVVSFLCFLMRALPLQLSAEYKQRRSPVHAKKNKTQQKTLSHVQLLPIYYHIYYYYLSLNLFFLVNCPGFCHLNAMKITKLHMHEGFAWKHQAGQKQNQNPPSCPCFSCTHSTSQEQEILHISWTALLAHHHARDNRLVYSSKQLSTRIFVRLETHPHHTTDVCEMHAHTEHIFKMT